jgi:hypothetical protein
VEDQGLTADEGHRDRAVIGGRGGNGGKSHGDEDRPGHGEHGEQLPATDHGRDSPTITLVHTLMK